MKTYIAGALIPLALLAFSGESFARTDYDHDGLDDIAFHQPGTDGTTVPVLFANGAGTWRSTVGTTPTWANQTGVVAIAGDYNNDGRTDLAFHKPGSTWSSLPVLMSVGNGAWNQSNFVAPSFANQPGVVAIPGDYNGDHRTDIAFNRPDGLWNSVPVLLSNGGGSFTSYNVSTPSWANQPGVVAVPGDFNADGRADLAFYRPGSWNSTPVLLSNGVGGWTPYNYATPTWANESGIIGIPGDYNADGRTDIAFHHPDSAWTTLPVLLSNGNGSWNTSAATAPSWAATAGTVAIAGDLNADGRTDLAFHRPDSTWATIPVLMRTAAGAWTAYNNPVPTYVHSSGVVALAGDYNGDGRGDLAFQRAGGGWGSVPVLLGNSNGTWTSVNASAAAFANATGSIAVQSQPKRVTLATAGSVADGGDTSYDRTAAQDSDWSQSVQGWINFLRLFVRIIQGYQEFLRQNGLNGQYDGTVSSTDSSTSARAYVELTQSGGQVNGRIVIMDATLRLPGGICSDVVLPVSALPVHAATGADLFHAHGSTTRNVTAVGIFSGTVDTTFDLALEQVNYQTLAGTIFMDVPWPCANQSLTFRFTRRPL